MTKVERFEDLDCWQQAQLLVREVYAIKDSGGLAQDPTLKDQIMRAANSTMMTIAAGFNKRDNKEFLEHLNFAVGHTAEVQSALHIAKDQRYITEDDFTRIYRQAETCRKFTSNLATYLTKNIYSYKK